MTEHERDVMQAALDALLSVKKGKFSEDSFKGRKLIEDMREVLVAKPAPAGKTYHGAARRQWVGLQQKDIEEFRKKATERFGSITPSAGYLFADLISLRLMESNHGRASQ